MNSSSTALHVNYSSTPRSRYIEICALLLICLGIFTYLTNSFWGETYDDVFLAYQYAKNIEAGNGFVFNPGEHFLGTPAPLFVSLLVGVHTILPALSLPQIGTLLSSAGLSIVAFSLFLLGRTTHGVLVSSAVSLIGVFNPFSLLVLGGESPLYLALIVTAFLALLYNRHILVGILLGLALMSRTEALIPIGVIVLWLLYTTRKIPVRLLLSLILTTLPWIAFATWQFGSPLTNSFIAKVSQVSSGRKPFPFGFARWFQTVIFGEHPALLLSLLPAGLGVIALMQQRSPFRLLAIWGVAQTLAYCVMPIPFYHWYAGHVGILAAILIAFGSIVLPSQLLAESTHRSSGTSKRGPSAALCAAPLSVRVGISALCASIGASTVVVLGSITREYDQRWPHHPANELYTKAGLWFAHNTAPSARIAYLEIGQIAFYSGRYIIDTLGLVTPGVAAEVAKRNWLWPLLRYKPDYIIYNEIFTKWPESGAIFKESWFTQGFQEVARISTDSYPVPLVVYSRLPSAVIPDPL